MTAFGSIKEKNEKNHLYIFRFINHSVFDILKYITVAAAIVLIVLIIVGYRKKKE